MQRHDGIKKKAIKINVTLHHPVHDTNDLGGFKMCHNNFNMYCKVAVDVTDTQLNASFLSSFQSSVNWVHIWLKRAACSSESLLYCFTTNQGHCMLIKFAVDGLNRIHAQAHNQCYSLNIFKWPYCEDDFIFLSNTGRVISCWTSESLFSS